MKEFIVKHKTVLIIALAAFLAVSATVVTLCVVLIGRDTKNYSTVEVSYSTYNQGYLSPSGAIVHGDYLYVSDVSKYRLYKIKKGSGQIENTYTGDAPIQNVYVDDDGVYILTGELDGSVTKLDSSLKAVQTVAAGHTPVDMLKFGENYYVANRFSNSVSVFRVSDLGFVKEYAVSREPIAMCATATDIFVACHLPSGAANADVVSADVSVIDPALGTVSAVSLFNGTGSVKDICVSADGERVYLTCVFSRYAYPTTQLDRGWINTNGITILDASTKEVVTGVLLDDVDRGAANPWGIGVTPATETEGSKILVTLSGLNELVVVDEAEMLSRIEAVKAGTGLVATLETIPDYVNFLDGAKERVGLPGEGCRALTVDGDTAYVCQYFTGNVVSINTSDFEMDSIKLGTQKKNDAVREGEILWYDASYCYQEWESCASCHPDARADGFNWDNLNDGLGNPKSTKSMVYSHRTPPEMVTGARPSAEIAVGKGMFFIQYNTVSQETLDNIDEYLRALKPVQSPYLNRDGTLTESATRGEKLFGDLNCASCHSGPNYTDMQKHVSTETVAPGENQGVNAFDTPTLVEVWRSGPWFFNGKAGTMEEAIRVQKGAESLNESQIQDLANYVLSIGDSGESYGVEEVFFTKKDGSVAVNLLEAGSKLDTVTVRKQAGVEDAEVLIGFYLSDGTLVSNTMYRAELKGMAVGGKAAIRLDMDIPKSWRGGYYVINIKRLGGKDQYAREFKVSIS